MFYVLHEKSLLVLRALLLLPVKHAQIHFNIFHSKDTTRRETILRDFLDHFSKTAAQIIFASCKGAQISYTIVYSECFCILVPFLLFTVPRPNLGQLKLFLTLGNGPAYSRRALEIPEEDKCGQKSVTTSPVHCGKSHWEDVSLIPLIKCAGWDLIWSLHEKGWTHSKNSLH